MRYLYPQGGYNIVYQPLAGDHSSGECEIFADGFAGPVKSPEKAVHRPSGVAVAPDGALFVADDVTGRIYRITYKGVSGTDAGEAKFNPCPSLTAPAGEIVRAEAKPPEGTHPDAGLPVPPGATQAMVALGDRIYHGEVGGATCTGCHGFPSAKGTPSDRTSPTTRGYGAMAVGQVSRRRSPTECRCRSIIVPPCPRWEAPNLHPNRCKLALLLRICVGLQSLQH